MKRLFIFLFLLLPSIANAQAAATRFVSATPTIDTSAYATGDVMSATAMTFANAVAPQKAQTGYIVSVMVSDAAAQAVDLDLVLFSTLPAAGTFGADNAAFDPTDAQILTIIGVVNLGSASRFAFNDNSVHYVGSLAIPVKSVPGTGGNVYGVLVARGAFTAAASTDVTVTLGIAQD